MHSTHIALCSDTHIWPGAQQRFGSEQSQLEPWSEQILETLLVDLSASKADLVIHLGDLTCGGGTFEMPDKEFFNTIDTAYQGFEALQSEFAILPGNHDCPQGGDWSYAENKFGLAPGLGRTIDLPTVRLVLVNAQGHSQEQLETVWPGDPTYGWVNHSELDRLENALATAGDAPVLIFIHQLLRPWVGDQPWRDIYGVRNAGAVVEILARHGNVRAVFQAHAHRLDVQQLTLGANPCWFIVNPAIIEYPLGWLQLTVSGDSLQVTLRQLPLPDLARLSVESGEGQAWRAGLPEWQMFTIPLSV